MKGSGSFNLRSRGKRDPYKLPISLGILMGMVWVPLTIRGSHYWGGP